MEELIGTLGPCPVHVGWCFAQAAHVATARREATVQRISREMNERGVDFQPGQRWAMKRGPRAARRVQARKAAARGR